MKTGIFDEKRNGFGYFAATAMVLALTFPVASSAKKSSVPRAKTSEAAPEPNQIQLGELSVAHLTRERVEGTGDASPDQRLIEYSVELGLAPVPVPTDRRQFLYLPHPTSTGVEVELFNPEFNYRKLAGAEPCSIPSESLPPAPSLDREQADLQQVRTLASTDLEKKVKALCSDSLYGFSETGVEKLSLLSTRSRWEDYVGLPHVTAVYAKPKSAIWFASSLPRTRLSSPPIKPETLRLTESQAKKLARPSVPRGLRDPKLTYYRYPSKEGGQYLVELRGEGGLTEESGELKWGEWSAWYFVNGDRVALLHDPKSKPPSERRFEGLLDLTGDGHADILLGSPVALVLERSADGFRSWHFAD